MSEEPYLISPALSRKRTHAPSLVTTRDAETNATAVYAKCMLPKRVANARACSARSVAKGLTRRDWSRVFGACLGLWSSFGCASQPLPLHGDDAAVSAHVRPSTTGTSSTQAEFGPRGLALHDERAHWTARLELAAYGCVRALRPALAQPRRLAAAEPGLVRYEHADFGASVHEWYQSDPAGLEHGFTLDAAPCSDEDARIELRVAGLRPVASSASGISLLDPEGVARLSYAQAHAEDATGRALPLELDARADRIGLTVGLAGATFPVRIDPLIGVQQPSALIASDGGSADDFGFALGLSNATALLGAPGHAVGANRDQGALYRFDRTESGWVRVGDALSADDGAAGDSFGFSLAVSGDTAVVGAPRHQVGDQPFQGAAYAFVRGATAWQQQGPALIAADGAAADAFGTSVAISLDTILVGAPAHDVASKTDQGAAYVFTRVGESWTQQGPALVAPDGQAGDTFGNAVALSADTALVGAPVRQVGENQYQGAAYVFVREGQRWRQQGADLTASDGESFDQFGPCALSGDRALVGAPYHAVGTSPGRGAAYSFTRVGDSWAQSGLGWSEADAQDGDQFGSAVALAGDTALVAAPQRRAEGNGYRGAGYLFTRSAESWSQFGSLLSAPGGAADELLASSIALSDDTALLGAPFHQVEDRALQGAAYAFALEHADSAPIPLDVHGGCALCRAAGGESHPCAAFLVFAALASCHRLRARRARRTRRTRQPIVTAVLTSGFARRRI